MASYCLTTYVANGKGTIAQIGDGTLSGCDGDPRGPDLTNTSCAADYPQGTPNIQLLAVPDTANGWMVEKWEMIRSDDGTKVYFFNGVGTNDPTTEAVSMSMPPFDVDVFVTFIHPDVNLILIPMTAGGCIKLISPTGGSYDNGCYYFPAEPTQLLPAFPAISIGADPDLNYQISAWTVDSVSAGSGSSITTSLVVAASSVTVRVWFTELPCDTNTLDVTIIGSGSVSHPTGEYCDNLTLNITPSPSFGYFFKKWQYNDTAITENGIIITVPMSANRNVTAIFEILPSFESPEGELFYCPSTTYKNNVVSFNFINDEANPSVRSGEFHFRMNFYSDSAKTKLLYSAFSLADNKRWFYNDTFFGLFPEGGISLDSYGSIDIIYDPEILPQQITETQREKFIGNNSYEYPLICGIKYYVDIESYDPYTGLFSFEKTISLILDCDKVDSYYWDYNKDDTNWLCSGQGKADLQVTSSSQSQSIVSAVSSNIHGIYQIVWQTRRDVFQVYGAVWDSESDILHSSGQGKYDELKLKAGYNPVVLTDQANNFYIAGNTNSDIYVNACPFPVSISDTPEDTTTTLFVNLCVPGMGVYLDSSYDQIKARVYQEDVSGSLVINKNKVVPIINKKIIRLDIDGISGAYAVRLRNINDPDWSGWININGNLYYEAGNLITSEDISYDAYKIDNSRFIVPWEVDKINGLRRVCCQVLTLYGITNVFCLDLFFNFDTPRHVFKFYSKKEGTGETATFINEFPTYNGQYVLSLKDENGIIQNVDSTVYFEVIFSEPMSYNSNDLTFNVIQQGINDLRGDTTNNPLARTSSKTFWGEFEIHKEDGVFNKDGNSFIEIIFPELARISACLSDSSDPYNLMISDIKAAEEKDLTPEEIYNKNQTDNVNKVFDLNQFKQYYDQDDSNFKFGNPGYFRK